MPEHAPGAGVWQRDGGDLVIAVRVITRAPRTAATGVRQGRLLVRVAAPAEAGRANAELLRWLAKTAGVARGSVRLDAGERSRDKRVRIADNGAAAR